MRWGGMTSAPHTYRVFSREHPDHRARVVEEPSFEAAAIAYVEDWPHTVDDDNAVRVIVRDLEDGREHCFVIDLDTGDAQSCG